MASSLIHAAVCNELNKKLKRDPKQILVGTVAPDIAKLLGETKEYTHFLDDPNSGVPNLTKFLNKYINYLDDDFVLGYYIHLYTDYLWFKYFIPEIYDESKNLIKKLDGTEVDCHGNMAQIYIYNDYTNINERVVNDYKLDLSFLYDSKLEFNDIIKEAHMDKMNIIIDKIKEIYEGSKIHREYIFDMDNIHNFIDLSVKLIAADLKEMNLMD